MPPSDCPSVVLVVEDDRDVRDAIVEVLEDSNYVTRAAGNGLEALEQLRSRDVRPCVILLDMMMPLMDGWQFRAVQQADPALSSIPVVVLSAHTSAREASELMHAAGFLRKPVQLGTLLAMVERFCGGERAR
jgi:CheY-like chemotaxis protein